MESNYTLKDILTCKIPEKLDNPSKKTEKKMKMRVKREEENMKKGENK